MTKLDSLKKESSLLRSYLCCICIFLFIYALKSIKAIIIPMFFAKIMQKINPRDLLKSKKENKHLSEELYGFFLIIAQINHITL